jgi:phage baseplate assembly protein gpV/phage protein D
MTAWATVPALRVELDGRPLGSAEGASLSAVQVRQALSLPSQCELAFSEPPAALAEAAAGLSGTRLAVAVEGEAQGLFSGEVTAVEYGYTPSRARELRVRAYDLLHRLRKRQPVCTRVELTPSELASDLVADLGIAVRTRTAGVLARRLVQWRQSDLELLTELSTASGLYFVLRAETLHLLTLEGEGEPVPLRLGESLLEARVEVNADPACRSVQTLGWDPWRAESHRGSAARARLGRTVEATADPGRVGSPGAWTLVDAAVQSDQQAEALAQSVLDQRLAGEVTLTGTARGDPRLCPGAIVEVEGLTGAVTGRYVLTSVRHSVDREHGFLSVLSTAPPVDRRRPATTVSTLAEVSAVDDPQGLGRIRVTLPAYGDLETDWLEVVLPAAGAGKGLIALPDVGDRVLVLLVQGDPAQGIVVGGLYGAKGPPDAGVEGGRVRRFTFVTPGGQRLYLDDGHNVARLESGRGNYLQLGRGGARLAESGGGYIELANGRVRVHAAGDLEIEAPGSVTIRGAAIDFRRS